MLAIGIILAFAGAWASDTGWKMIHQSCNDGIIILGGLVIGLAGVALILGGIGLIIAGWH